jgi:RhtB (resistance to homoserine/threonine) family protein
MNHVALIGSVTAIHLLAVVSPGPDFIMAARNSLVYSRRTGIWTAAGFGAGIAVHILYSLAGLALLISKSILLFNAIKLLGAGYLVYIGIRSLLSKAGSLEIGEQAKRADISPWRALRIGFLTNVLNPKATLFFLSLFTMVIAPDTPLPVMGLLSAIMIGNTILWFSLVAVFLTQPRIRGVFERSQNVFNRTLGGLLVALGVKVALSQR